MKHMHILFFHFVVVHVTKINTLEAAVHPLSGQTQKLRDLLHSAYSSGLYFQIWG